MSNPFDNAVNQLKDTPFDVILDKLKEVLAENELTIFDIEVIGAARVFCFKIWCRK